MTGSSVFERSVEAAVMVVLACSSGCVDAKQTSAHTSVQAGSIEIKRPSMKDDLANRSPDIHWPDGFKPETADLFAHNELLIGAPCEKVWDHIVDGAKTLGQTTRWRWTTFGFAIESQVHEYELHSRLGWYGYAVGTPPAFYHTWLLQPQGAGCLVTTDEVGIGQTAANLRQTNETSMHRGHELWLATLKWVAEGR